MIQWYTPEQLTGSEYGGVEKTWATIQPKDSGNLTNAEKLKLEYLTGVDATMSLEDRRQMLGLRPAEGRHPQWLKHVSPTNDPRLTSEAERQGYTDSEKYFEIEVPDDGSPTP